MPTLTVTLPTLHTGVASDRWPGVPGNWGGQVEACIFTTQHRHTAITCGRRWGKTALLIALAADEAVESELRHGIEQGHALVPVAALPWMAQDHSALGDAILH